MYRNIIIASIRRGGSYNFADVYPFYFNVGIICDAGTREEEQSMFQILPQSLKFTISI